MTSPMHYHIVGEPHGAEHLVVRGTGGQVFYTVSLGTCDVCRKPATKEVRGPHNAKYGHVCSSPRCEKKRLASLEQTHRGTPEESMPRA